jgi:putative transposase
MKRSRFIESRSSVFCPSRKPGLRMKVAEECRKHGMSEQAFSSWKAKFGGMSILDATQPRRLEEENARPKRLLAKAMLDNAVSKNIASRKW